MDPVKLIQKYYSIDSTSYNFLINHSNAVTKKAIEIAKKVPHLNPDLKFIKEASMLHDIGIFLTNAPGLGCFGEKPYICHGYLGREVLEKEGFLKHALVCERHFGTGISIKDIDEQKLPFPRRDMLPISIDEQIIFFADKFFSKHKNFLSKEKSLDEIRTGLLKFGDDKLKIFNDMIKKFRY